MSDERSAGGGGGGTEETPEVVVEGRRGISPVWLIPLVALAAAATLAWDAIQNRGPEVTVVFSAAEGLEAGKSKVKYRGVEIGTVDSVRILDADHVQVKSTLAKGMAPYLTTSTLFWVVRPRVGGGGFSGLGTIISGSYLTMRNGDTNDPSQREFTGLEEPPLAREDLPGIPIVLHTDHLSGLDAGAPIFFRDIHVGDVLHYELRKDGRTVDVHATIGSSHADLVRTNSRFWNAGGVELTLGSGGLDIKTEDLASILSGGVAFDSPGGGEPAKKGQAFWLHRSRADVDNTALTHGGLRLVLETTSLGGVGPGNPIYYREVPVGAVVSHELSKDGSKVLVTANVQRRYQSLVRSNSVFWNAGGISASLGITGLHVHAESLKALLSGGIAFATPPRAGHTVKPGSVFRLHPEGKDQWRKWTADLSGQPQEKERGRISRFFHHEGKSEEQAREDDPSPEPTHDEKKHGFLHGLFH